MRRALLLTWLLTPLFASACKGPPERPIHPWKLEGFPGAPIEGDLFPLRNGATWAFRDRLDPSKGEQTWTLLRSQDGWLLRGLQGGDATLDRTGHYIEIRRAGKLVDRPLRLQGRAGDSWKAAGAYCLVMGYDRLQVLGEPRRALVVGVERKKDGRRSRDIYWFVDGIGWARVRHERDGNAISDAHLIRFDPGSAD